MRLLRERTKLTNNFFEPGNRQHRMAQQPSPAPEADRNQQIGREEGAQKVEIYTWRFCPYCIRAKGLLDRKGVIYNEYMIDGDETARQAMIRRAEGRSTLPQIFINNRAIGGCDDLMELDRTGWLNQLLSIEA
jgi:glutaredoxin 3